MQFSLLAILSFAALAIATPTTGHVVSARTAKPLGQRNVQDAAQACGTKQVPACCNQASKNSADRGILSNILTDVVGLNCVAIPVSVLTTGDQSTQDVCGAESDVKCCDGQNGFINEKAECH